MSGIVAQENDGCKPIRLGVFEAVLGLSKAPQSRSAASSGFINPTFGGEPPSRRALRPAKRFAVPICYEYPLACEPHHAQQARLSHASDLADVRSRRHHRQEGALPPPAGGGRKDLRSALLTGSFLPVFARPPKHRQAYAGMPFPPAGPARPASHGTTMGIPLRRPAKPRYTRSPLSSPQFPGAPFGRKRRIQIQRRCLRKTQNHHPLVRCRKQPLRRSDEQRTPPEHPTKPGVEIRFGRAKGSQFVIHD